MFLDVDGTLLEIAPSPHAVGVPDGLTDLLARLHRELAGAIALVSGRRLRDLDRLFAPLHLPAAGLHGLEQRAADSRGTPTVRLVPGAVPALAHARRRLAPLLAEYPALVYEDKGLALALHYRSAPELEAVVLEHLQVLVIELGPSFHLQPGKCVLELKPACASKRSAIEAFMQELPFRGRRPLFVGDDLTDEDGFVAVNALGGDSIRVGPPAATAAGWRLDSVPDVMRWLAGTVSPERQP